MTDKAIEKWTPAGEANLPAEVQALAAFRTATDEATQLLVMGELACVRWDLLADAAKGPRVWSAIARKMGPQALRMNLNTLLRHDAFSVKQLSPTVSGDASYSSVSSDSKRLGQSFYTNMVGCVPSRIADESEILRSQPRLDGLSQAIAAIQFEAASISAETF